MPEYYFQIKGKSAKGQNEPSFYGSVSNWVWPPIWSDKVEAIDIKEAHQKINELYGKEFPRRVLKKDLDSNDFLLSIKLIESGSHTEDLFITRKCEECGKEFKPIDKYQLDLNGGGHRFCDYTCSKKFYKAEYDHDRATDGTHNPVIYKITNKLSGKCYIGKTTQAFTLRWYQHFFQSDSVSKFHDAIKDSNISDWTFEVLEKIDIPNDIKQGDEMNDFILRVEQDYINKHNSIKGGYNSVISKDMKKIDESKKQVELL